LAKIGFAGLLLEQKNEAVRVSRLHPSRYVLVTSVPLSTLNKDAIVNIIGADALKPSDVIGCEDLNTTGPSTARSKAIITSFGSPVAPFWTEAYTMPPSPEANSRSATFMRRPAATCRAAPIPWH
jgi:hypothetical protein